MAGRGTGLDAQFGMVAEATPGTAVTVTRFLEIESESIKADIGQYTPLLLGRGDTVRGANTRTWVKGAKGDVKYVVQTAGYGLLLKALLGAVATSGVGDPYTHTITPDAVGLKGLSSTVQIGRPDTSGTVQPFTYAGAKPTKAVLEFKVDQPLTLTVSWDAWTESTAVALASKSFATGAVPLIFSDGSATINGSAISIKSGKVEIDTGVDVNRRFIGNSKKEQLRNAEFKVIGDLEYEFEALTRHGDLVAGTLLNTLVLDFTNGTHGLTTTINQMLYTPGGEPVVSSADVVQEQMSWMAVDDGTNPFIQFDYVTSDATP